MNNDDIRGKQKMIREYSKNTYLLHDDSDRGERKINDATDFNFEMVRYNTFHYFKHKNNSNIDQLAKRGFIYNRNCDIVMCHFCSMIIQKVNNTYEEHREHKFGNVCHMAIFPLNGNVPRDDTDTDPEYYFNVVNQLFRKLLFFKNNTIPDASVPIQFDRYLFGSDINAEDFSSIENRLSTFKFWFLYVPRDQRPRKELYALAGFVYTGNSDIVVCFKCKGALFNIDNNDDPIQDHYEYYGHCPFIKQFKRECEMNPLRSRIPEMINSEEQNLLMQHPVVQFLLHRGYEKPFVKEWMLNHVNSCCCFPNTITECEKKLQKYLSSR